MTHRTEYEQTTAVEKATAEVLRTIDGAATMAHAQHHLSNPTTKSEYAYTEPQFRRLLVLYLHGKSLKEWAEVLGVPDPEGHEESE